ncbi:MAG: divalent-cation tolerance protein CutA [Rhodanobacteraceae bacterium]
MSALIAFSTVANDAAARRLARALVDERLAACVSRVPGVTSTYRWQGEVREEAEVLLVIKTTRERLDALQLRLAELHDYQAPELLAIEACAGLPSYLAWVADETRPA